MDTPFCELFMPAWGTLMDRHSDVFCMAYLQIRKRGGFGLPHIFSG